MWASNSSNTTLKEQKDAIFVINRNENHDQTNNMNLTEQYDEEDRNSTSIKNGFDFGFFKLQLILVLLPFGDVN